MSTSYRQRFVTSYEVTDVLNDVSQFECAVLEYFRTCKQLEVGFMGYSVNIGSFLYVNIC